MFIKVTPFFSSYKLYGDTQIQVNLSNILTIVPLFKEDGKAVIGTRFYPVWEADKAYFDVKEYPDEITELIEKARTESPDYKLVQKIVEVVGKILTDNQNSVSNSDTQN